MANWNVNYMPKCKDKSCSEECLVTVDNGRCKRVLKAVYIPYHHCTVEDLGWGMPDGVPDDWEYVEDVDSWWIPEGWYETVDYFEDYSYATIADKVVAWSKLPKPYEPRVKQLIEVKECDADGTH